MNHIDEGLIRHYFENRGWIVRSARSLSEAEDHTAPMIRSKADGSWLILPDLLCQKLERRVWLEVKSTYREDEVLLIKERHVRHYDVVATQTETKVRILAILHARNVIRAIEPRAIIQKRLPVVDTRYGPCFAINVSDMALLVEDDQFPVAKHETVSAETRAACSARLDKAAAKRRKREQKHTAKLQAASPLQGRIDELTAEIGSRPDVRDPRVGDCIKAAKLLRAHAGDLAKTAAELKIDLMDAHVRAVVGMRLMVKEVLPPDPRVVPVPVTITAEGIV